MTCKNCLYFNMCYVLADNPAEAEVEGAETDCSSFKDRSKYVAREKGEWKRRKNWPAAVCPACSFEEKEPRNFCPNCGADMRIEEQNRAREVENDG